VHASDLSYQLEATTSAQQDVTNHLSSRETRVTNGDYDSNICRSYSDEDTEDNSRWWASDYDDDDMVFQLSDIDDDDNHRGTHSWADETIQAVSSSVWNGSFSHRVGDAVPPNFDDDSGNGYSCESTSPCHLLNNVPSLPAV